MISFGYSPVANTRRILDAARPRLAPTLKALPLAEFLKAKFVKKEEILRSKSGVLLYHPSIVQVHAWRGTGKTTVCMHLANTLSRADEFFRWQGVRPLRVLD